MDSVRVKRPLLQDEIESLRAIDRLFERGDISFIQMGEAKATIKYRYFPKSDGHEMWASERQALKRDIRAWKSKRMARRAVELDLLNGRHELPDWENELHVTNSWMREAYEAFVNTDAWKRNQRVNA